MLLYTINPLPTNDAHVVSWTLYNYAYRVYRVKLAQMWDSVPRYVATLEYEGIPCKLHRRALSEA